MRHGGFLALVGTVFLGALSVTAEAVRKSYEVVFSADGTSKSSASVEAWRGSSEAHNAFILASFPEHQLRVTNVESKLCDGSVKQHSGYLDISDGRHLFFWFFEARSDPANAPLMLWLNGGPGCSSIGSGLLFENGPCHMSESGNETVHNPYSWNEHLNIIYLDEPIGTGFSYASDGSKVDTLADLAVDVYAFLTMFLKKYPEYAGAPLHVAAESWGGHYGPHIASYIYEMNKEVKYYPRRPGMVYMNLASLILANGLTEPYTQFESIPEYYCGGAPYPYYDPKSWTCRTMGAKARICLPLISACYKTKAKAACVLATNRCWSTLLQASADVDPYDIRRECDTKSDTCYSGLDAAQRWMDQASVKKALGADVNAKFKVCNFDVNSAFFKQGQAMLNSAELLPDLVGHGIRLLVYAGDADSVCNYIGVERWMTRLENDFHDEFSSASRQPWHTSKSKALAGEVRFASGGAGGAGNYTFVRVYEAGHLVPHDQPEAALDMIEKWVHNLPW